MTNPSSVDKADNDQPTDINNNKSKSFQDETSETKTTNNKEQLELPSSEGLKSDSQHETNRKPPDLEKQETDGEIYSAFTFRERMFIIVMTSMAAFFSPLSGQIYFPAIPELANDYHTSIGKINLTITTYMIFQGLAPTIFGNLGDSTGRRPAYIIAFSIYSAANIGLATQHSYAALLALRCLQSAGSSGTIALGFGVISDISTPAQRGMYLGPVAAGIMLAPAFGPTIGGLLDDSLGWRSIFWFLTIVSGVYLSVYILFMPETLRKIVGDGSIRPQSWWVLSPYQYWRLKKTSDANSTVATQKSKLVFPNPMKSIRVLREKDALCIILELTMGSAGIMALLASLPPLLEEVYGFDSLQVGLCYM